MAAKVIVIGAGIAGLCAAYRLQQLGCEVEVLEQRDWVGGRMAQRRLGTLWYRSGARLFYSFPGSLSDVIDELNLRASVCAVQQPPIVCVDREAEYAVSLHVHAKLLRSRVLPWRERLRLPLLILPLLRARWGTSPDRLATAVPFDAASMSQDLIARVGPAFTELWVEPLFRGTRNWNSAQVSSAFLYLTSGHSLGRGGPLTFREGIGQLTRTLGRLLAVRTRCGVLQIEEGPDRCWVRARVDERVDRELEADFVVCAVEGARALGICAAAASHVREFLSSIRYCSVGIAHYQLSGDVVPTLKVFTRRSARQLGLFEQYAADPASGAPAGLYCQSSPEATQLLAQRDGRGISALLESDVRREFPTLETRVVARHEQWIEHMLPIPYPGYAAAVRRFEEHVQRACSRVVYCGDYLSQALVTGAADSGIRAARLINAHWLKATDRPQRR